MRPLVAAMVLAVAGMSVAGCIPFIMRGDVIRRDAGWTVTLEALKDGPNQVPMGANTVGEPGAGVRFLWAWVRIRNDLNATRVFGYDSCDMDLDDEVVLPTVVGWLFGVIDERKDSYRPGETLERRLIFSYPNGRLPTRIRCGGMIFAVPGPPVQRASR